LLVSISSNNLGRDGSFAESAPRAFRFVQLVGEGVANRSAAELFARCQEELFGLTPRISGLESFRAWPPREKNDLLKIVEDALLSDKPL
jgi:hypothetical protein